MSDINKNEILIQGKNIKAKTGNVKHGIVINRMYAGSYLASNLGHEVINMYCADNGNHYLYLNATGDFAKKHKDKIGYMLLVKYYKDGLIQVLGKAEGLEDVYDANQIFSPKYGINPAILSQQLNFIAGEKGGVNYAGVPIYDIFKGNPQQSIFISFKAEKLYRVKKGKRLFIQFSNASEENIVKNGSDIVIKLPDTKQAKTSLKQYFYPGDNDYEAIKSLFMDGDIDLWEEIKEKLVVEKTETRKLTLFDICGINNDENIFSNVIAYFMQHPEYTALWNDFFKKFGVNLGDSYTVSREEAFSIKDKKGKTINGRIDIMIRTENSFIVIENKIRSGINGVEGDVDGKQLERYCEYVTNLLDDSSNAGKKAEFFILVPNYNIPSIECDDYTIITYGDLYKFLTDNLDKISHDSNFMAFYEAIFRHTFDNVNDYHYYEMQERLSQRLRQEKF